MKKLFLLVIVLAAAISSFVVWEIRRAREASADPHLRIRSMYRTNK